MEGMYVYGSAVQQQRKLQVQSAHNASGNDVDRLMHDTDSEEESKTTDKSAAFEQATLHADRNSMEFLRAASIDSSAGGARADSPGEETKTEDDKPSPRSPSSVLEVVKSSPLTPPNSAPLEMEVGVLSPRSMDQIVTRPYSQSVNEQFGITAHRTPSSRVVSLNLPSIVKKNQRVVNRGRRFIVNTGGDANHLDVGGHQAPSSPRLSMRAHAKYVRMQHQQSSAAPTRKPLRIRSAGASPVHSESQKLSPSSRQKRIETAMPSRASQVLDSSASSSPTQQLDKSMYSIGVVASGSANKLVEKLVDINDSDLSYRATFLLTFREFLSPVDLLRKIIRLYMYYDENALLIDKFLGQSAEAGFSDSDRQQLKLAQTQSLKYRLRIFAVLKTWTKEYFEVDFLREHTKSGASLIEALLSFLRGITLDSAASQLLAKVAQSLIASVDKCMADHKDKQREHDERVRNQGDDERKTKSNDANNNNNNSSSSNLSVSASTSREDLPRLMGQLRRQMSATVQKVKAEVKISDITTTSLKNKSQQIAEQLTMIEFEYYNRIGALEMVNCEWLKKDSEQRAPHVHRFVRRFNEVSFWVATTVLVQKSSKKRVHALRKMVKIAYACWQLGNFHAVFEIIAGLQHHAVFRLRDLRRGNKLRGKEKEKYDKLLEIFDTVDNYGAYRRELDNAFQVQSSTGKKKGTFVFHPLVLPHMGIAMKDLAGLHERRAILPDGAVDFARLRGKYDCAMAFVKGQRPVASLPFKTNAKLQRVLKDEVLHALSEAELMKLSFSIESVARTKRNR
eukprot:TRINITY_DN67549_c8_g1_i1.p1 TRINITY_DN67549_c8_g1~~TRINITY_DN67549_c8_g1_i1.p1  ORF type:complete len:907 (-),score=498.83 TRINITY_DN67549_c8_g1_i1:123-2498(-)